MASKNVSSFCRPQFRSSQLPCQHILEFMTDFDTRIISSATETKDQKINASRRAKENWDTGKCVAFMY